MKSVTVGWVLVDIGKVERNKYLLTKEGTAYNEYISA